MRHDDHDDDRYDDADFTRRRRNTAWRIAAISGGLVFAAIYFGAPVAVEHGLIGVPYDGHTDAARQRLLWDGARNFATVTGLITWALARLLLPSRPT
jgi:hypothetical protein